MPSVGGYAYAVGENALYVNQFIASESVVDMPEGPVGLKVSTLYPWDGRVEIEITRCGGARTLKLRRPDWCGEASLSVNGRAVTDCADGYYTLEIAAGDRIVYEMRMEIRRVYADPRVAEDAGRVAIMRGPVVYCAEETDNPGISSEYFHADKALSRSTALTAKYEPELLDGVVAISGDGVKLVPYFAWDNREVGAMTVWMRETE